MASLHLDIVLQSSDASIARMAPRNSRCSILAWISVLYGLSTLSTPALAEAPILYHQPTNESPWHVAPDELLLIPGYGFSAADRVIYAALTDTTGPLRHPGEVPTRDTALAGVASIVSTANVPYSLTARLPEQLRADQSYGLWVRTAAGQWSAGIKVNDARPLWFTPAFAYASARVGGLPRYLKVIGRNLEPVAGTVTKIRLSGPASIILPVRPPPQTGPLAQEFVAQISLPARLQPGRYKVELNRDGHSWVAVGGQALEVLPDPRRTQAYPVDSPQFGGCRADDGRDDTKCVVRAIAAATRDGGGTVLFGNGTWDLIDSTQIGVARQEGIVVPRGVNLEANDNGTTRIVRHAEWSAAVGNPAFTLLGHNTVQGLVFANSERDRPPPGITAPAFLQIGELYVFAKPAKPDAPQRIDDVTITSNTFDRVIGIADAGLPIRHLFITNNDFGVSLAGVMLGGNRFNMKNQFRIDDAVIAYNHFEPGGYLDIAHRSGSTASDLGAGYRVDFSHNIADGASHKYLQAPYDTPGWRAAFFWHLQNNHEQVLISQNKASCTADLLGDGEAIAFDNNANTFAFTGVRTVLASSPNSVTVAGPLITTQNNRAIPVATYYLGHWLQVDDGPGIGQVRRIVGYTIAADSGAVTFRLEPAWDVSPIAGRSRLSVGREFWQVYVIDNTIDLRNPPCLGSNRSRNAGGVISAWAQSADSVIAGNHQFGSDGIWVHENYSPTDPPCAQCSARTFFQSFLEIRGNQIVGAYRHGIDCGISGISADISAPSRGVFTPPTLGYGISISENVLINVNHPGAGAISMPPSGPVGPAPHRWPLLESPIIQHNIIETVDDPTVPRCPGGLSTAGISFPANDVVWHAVQYANSCHGVLTGTAGHSYGGTAYCPTHISASCECPANE